jgi:hypothetical protein
MDSNNRVHRPPGVLAGCQPLIGSVRQQQMAFADCCALLLAAPKFKQWLALRVPKKGLFGAKNRLPRPENDHSRPNDSPGSRKTNPMKRHVRQMPSVDVYHGATSLLMTSHRQEEDSSREESDERENGELSRQGRCCDRVNLTKRRGLLTFSCGHLLSPS